MVVFGGYFTLDNLGMVPQFVSNFKAYGFNKEEIVIVLLLVLFFGVSAVIRFMSQNDFHDGTYTPKIMAENAKPIFDNHISVEVK